MKKIVFATHNQGKLREAQELLVGYEVLDLGAIGVTVPPEETGETLEENAKIKAQYVWDNFHVPCFSEDSGVFIKALQGSPGIYAARYDGPKGDPVERVLIEMGLIEERNAEMVACVIYIDENGEEHKFVGSTSGTIAREKRGNHGFAYDSVFIPEGYDQTYGELDPEIKRNTSHRSKAIKELSEYLERIK